jgi:hypothetical protein
MPRPVPARPTALAAPTVLHQTTPPCGLTCSYASRAAYFGTHFGAPCTHSFGGQSCSRPQPGRTRGSIPAEERMGSSGSADAIARTSNCGRDDVGEMASPRQLRQRTDRRCPLLVLVIACHRTRLPNWPVLKNKAAPAAPQARRQRRAQPFPRPARRTPGHTPATARSRRLSRHEGWDSAWPSARSRSPISPPPPRQGPPAAVAYRRLLTRWPFTRVLAPVRRTERTRTLLACVP